MSDVVLVRPCHTYLVVKPTNSNVPSLAPAAWKATDWWDFSLQKTNKNKMNGSYFAEQDPLPPWKVEEKHLGHTEGFRATALPLPLLQLNSAALFFFCPLAPSRCFLLIPLDVLVHYFNPSLTLSFHLSHVASPKPGRTHLSTFSKPASGEQSSARQKAHIQALQRHNLLS